MTTKWYDNKMLVAFMVLAIFWFGFSLLQAYYIQKYKAELELKEKKLHVLGQKEEELLQTMNRMNKMLSGVYIEITAIDKELESLSGSITNLRAQKESINRELQGLYEKQKSLINRKAELLKQTPGVSVE